MTIATANVSANQTFGAWLTLTNKLARIISQNTVTVDSTTGGSQTIGNGHVLGYFGADYLYSNVSFTANAITSDSITSANVTISTNLFVTGGVSSDIIPTSNTAYNLGSFNEWFNNLFVNISYTNSAITTNLTVEGNSTLSSVFSTNSSSVYVNTSFISTSNIQLTNATAISNIAGTLHVANLYAEKLDFGTLAAGNFIPSTNNAYTLGDTAMVWSAAYASNVYSNSVITGNVSSIDTITTNKTAANYISLSDIAELYSGSYTFVNTTAAANVDVELYTSYRSFDYTVQMSDITTVPASYHLTKLLIVQDDAGVYLTEYGTIYNNMNLGTITAGLAAGNFFLQVAPNTANVVVKYTRTAIFV